MKTVILIVLAVWLAVVVHLVRRAWRWFNELFGSHDVGEAPWGPVEPRDDE